MSALDQYVPGQRVRAYWTNCNRDYEADGTITRVNAKTVRVDIDGATILKTGLEWENGKLTPFVRTPAPRASFNTVIPVPGTKLNRVEAIEAASLEDIEAAKETERTRLSRKAARFDGFASNAQKSSDAAWQKSHDLVDDIPMGQPILVDHYSAKRHRRILQRSEDAVLKAFSEAERAEKWARRADGVEREMRRKGLL